MERGLASALRTLVCISLGAVLLHTFTLLRCSHTWCLCGRELSAPAPILQSIPLRDMGIEVSLEHWVKVVEYFVLALIHVISLLLFIRGEFFFYFSFLFKYLYKPFLLFLCALPGSVSTSPGFSSLHLFYPNFISCLPCPVLCSCASSCTL